jgi:protein-S-isoprenylcysteine O-methyltransferase Ste14
MPRGFPDLPPVWAAGLALAAWALARWVPVVHLPAGLGRAFLAAGLGLILWAGWWFWKKRTPIKPHHRPRVLITEGPFRLNRNPIYTGLALMLLGWGLALGAVSALLPALAFPLIVTRRFVLAEEAALREAFGAEAEEWLAATRRW